MIPIPIVALDVPTFDDALTLVQTLGDSCRFYKVGSELFTAEGPRIVSALCDRGCKVFLDLKFHDIPNTVRKAAASASQLGASMITVHVLGGEDMIKAAVSGVGPDCKVLAVTILTSLGPFGLADIFGKPDADIDLPAEVRRLAGIAKDAGAAGVVCSGHEARDLHNRFPELELLIPGIRLRSSPRNDQIRTITPAEAAEVGATYIILGRTVTQTADPKAAMTQVREALVGRGMEHRLE